MEYTPFHKRYPYGSMKEVVPDDTIHARQLSASAKKSLKRLKGDLAKKTLVDPLTSEPVTSEEYRAWRGRATRAVKRQEKYLETVSGYCGRHKSKGRSARRARRSGSLNF